MKYQEIAILISGGRIRLSPVGIKRTRHVLYTTGKNTDINYTEGSLPSIRIIDIAKTIKSGLINRPVFWLAC